MSIIIGSGPWNPNGSTGGVMPGSDTPPDLNRSNNIGIVYFSGDEQTNGSIRSKTDGGKFTLQKLIDGFWVDIQSANENETMLKTSVKTGLSSFHLGDIHSIGSAGENVIFKNQETSVCWFPVWQGISQDGVTVYDPTFRSYGPLLNLQPVGSGYLSKGALPYMTVTSFSSNYSGYGIEFIPAEDFSGVLNWSGYFVGSGRGIVESHSFSANLTSGIPHFFQFEYPIEVRSGSIVRTEITKDLSGEILMCRPTLSVVGSPQLTNLDSTSNLLAATLGADEPDQNKFSSYYRLFSDNSQLNKHTLTFTGTSDVGLFWITYKQKRLSGNALLVLEVRAGDSQIVSTTKYDYTLEGLVQSHSLIHPTLRGFNNGSVVVKETEEWVEISVKLDSLSAQNVGITFKFEHNGTDIYSGGDNRFQIGDFVAGSNPVQISYVPYRVLPSRGFTDETVGDSGAPQLPASRATEVTCDQTTNGKSFRLYQTEHVRVRLDFPLNGETVTLKVANDNSGTGIETIGSFTSEKINDTLDIYLYIPLEHNYIFFKSLNGSPVTGTIGCV